MHSPAKQPRLSTVLFGEGDSSEPTAGIELHNSQDRFSGDGDAATQRDKKDMVRMGKEQLFRRDFKLFPSFAFVLLVQLTWVCLLT